ncbi:MAG: hypothetical protein KKF80_04035, partial [Candidatus Omnitrophica bacterium]|nr:hypothetical protein [Candidatus Omnitrophota bacterium]
SVFTAAVAGNATLNPILFYKGKKTEAQFRDIKVIKPVPHGKFIIHSHPFILWRYRQVATGQSRLLAEGEILPGPEESEVMRRIGAKAAGIVWGNREVGFYLTVVLLDRIPQYQELYRLSSPGEKGNFRESLNTDRKIIAECNAKGAIAFYRLLPGGVKGVVRSGDDGVIPLRIKPEEALAIREKVYQDPHIAARDDERILIDTMRRAALSSDSEEALRKRIQVIEARLKAIEQEVARLVPQLQSSYEQVKRQIIELQWEYKVISWEAKGLHNALEKNRGASSSPSSALLPMEMPLTNGRAMHIRQNTIVFRNRIDMPARPVVR